MNCHRLWSLYETGHSPVTAPDTTGQQLHPHILKIQREHQSFKASLILHLSHSVVAATLVMPACTSVKFTSVWVLKVKLKKKKKINWIHVMEVPNDACHLLQNNLFSQRLWHYIFETRGVLSSLLSLLLQLMTVTSGGETCFQIHLVLRAKQGSPPGHLPYWHAHF